MKMTKLMTGISTASLVMLFGASAAQAAQLAPHVAVTSTFTSSIVASDTNNNNNIRPNLVGAPKPAGLLDLAA